MHVSVFVYLCMCVRVCVAYVCKCRPITSKAGRGAEIGWALGLGLSEWQGKMWIQKFWTVHGMARLRLNRSLPENLSGIR